MQTKIDLGPWTFKKNVFKYANLIQSFSNEVTLIPLGHLITSAGSLGCANWHKMEQWRGTSYRKIRKPTLQLEGQRGWGPLPVLSAWMAATLSYRWGCCEWARCTSSSRGQRPSCVLSIPSVLWPCPVPGQVQWHVAQNGVLSSRTWTQA